MEHKVRGGRGGRGRGGRGRGAAGQAVRRPDGLFEPLGLPLKHTAVDGRCYSPMCRPNMIKNRELFSPRPDDCLVVTYPRNGTTWTLEVLRQIHLVHNVGLESDHPLLTQSHKVSAPWINLGSSDLDSKPGPRIMKSHNHYQHLNVAPDTDTKIIHVFRDPRDVLCSCYHHTTALPHIFDYQGTFEEYVGHFLAGAVESGSYWEFNREYLENREGYNILHLTYEELAQEKVASLQKINKFLGYVELSSAEVAQIDAATTFEAMKGTQVSLNVDTHKIVGKTGRYAEMLNQSQTQQVMTKNLSGFQTVREKIPRSYFVVPKSVWQALD